MNGRIIPYIIEYAEESEKNAEYVCIICHGFGSSKESPTAVSMAERLKKEGISSIRFDFPAHGESECEGEDFLISNCLDDLEEIETIAGKKFPGAKLFYFASSFGAFINLIYLSTRKHRGVKSFLRCAAVDMPGIMHNWIDGEYLEKLKEDGYLMFDEGYARPLKVTEAFYDELDRINLFELRQSDIQSGGADSEAFPSGGTVIRMIHGTEDETAPYEDAVRFAQTYSIPVISVKGADHRFTTEGAMDIVRDAACEFYRQ